MCLEWEERYVVLQELVFGERKGGSWEEKR